MKFDLVATKQVQQIAADCAAVEALAQRIDALLPEQYRYCTGVRVGLLGDFEKLVYGLACDCQRLILRRIAVHLGLPFIVLDELEDHVLQDGTGPDEEWKGCGCPEFATE